MYVYSIIFIDCAGIKRHKTVKAKSLLVAYLQVAEEGEVTEIMKLPIEVEV